MFAVYSYFDAEFQQPIYALAALGGPPAQPNFRPAAFPAPAQPLATATAITPILRQNFIENWIYMNREK